MTSISRKPEFRRSRLMSGGRRSESESVKKDQEDLKSTMAKEMKQAQVKDAAYTSQDDSVQAAFVIGSQQNRGPLV